jgi:hypothetical protein
MTQGHDYPFYADPPNDRSRVLWYFALAAFLICAGAYAGYHKDISEFLQFWTILGASAPLLIYGALNKLFDSYLWKTTYGRGLMSFVGMSVPPDISGNYTLELTWNDPLAPAGEKSKDISPATMIIVQTWKKISVVFVFQDRDSSVARASSTSRMALIEETADGRVLLNYLYTYRGISERIDGKGVRKLRLDGTCFTVFYKNTSGQWCFHGDYYSDDSGTGIIKQTFELGDARKASTSESE